MIETLLLLLIALVILWLIYYAATLFGLPEVPLRILGIILFLVFLLYALRSFHLIPP